MLRLQCYFHTNSSNDKRTGCFFHFSVFILASCKLFLTPSASTGETMYKNFLHHKRNKKFSLTKNYSMFSRWFSSSTAHEHTFRGKYWKKEITERKKNPRRTGKNKEIFKFYGVEWCRVLRRKVWKKNIGWQKIWKM